MITVTFNIRDRIFSDANASGGRDCFRVTIAVKDLVVWYDEEKCAALLSQLVKCLA